MGKFGLSAAGAMDDVQFVFETLVRTAHGFARVGHFFLGDSEHDGRE